LREDHVVTVAWIAVALIFAIVEVATVGLFAAFIALGAVAAAVAAFLGFDLLVQAVALAIVAVAGIVVARPPLLRYLQARRRPELLSGAAAMVGRITVVVDPIPGPDGRGHVRIAGEDWPARSRDGQPVPAGVSVRVVAIHGATLVVDRVPEPPELPA
jgi:membrane protein implicated in regulation of membrane protease activity